MPEFRYARGRIVDSIRYLSEELKEFQEDYAERTWQDYQKDKKLQKLIDRTVENILTALIEVCGAFLTNQGISAESSWRRPEKGWRASGPNGAGTKRPRRIGPAEESPCKLNATGPLNIAKVAKGKNPKLIHISTDYVFDGTKEGAYTEEDIPNPISIYGASKYQGELNIQETLKEIDITSFRGHYD